MVESVDRLRGEEGKDDFMQWTMNTLDQQQYQAAVVPNPLAYGGAGSGGCRTAFDGAAFPSLQALRQSTAAVGGGRDLTVQVDHQQPSCLSTNYSDNPGAIMDHDLAAAGAGWSPLASSATGRTGISSSRPMSWNLSAATTSAQPPAAARRGHNSTPTAGRTSGGSAQSTAASSESKVVQDPIMAERRRREKINAHFTALSAVVPGVKKDKSTILGEAVKYVRELEEKVKTLEEKARAAAATTTRSALLVNKKIKPDNEDDAAAGGPSHGGGGGLPEIEVRVWGEKSVLVQIHCENARGLLVRVLAEVEDLRLAITHTTSVMPFPDPTVIITITAKVEEGFNSTVEEIVKRLGSSLAPTLRPP